MPIELITPSVLTVRPSGYPATAGHGGPAPLLIFTHGNGELAEQWVEEFAEPRSWGWAVLLPEYPGYGPQPATSLTMGHPA
jgi:pimeloyl-ACP methyl ester carboxylesterase